MKKKSVTALLTAAIICSLTFTGCSGEKAAPASDSTQTQESSETAQTAQTAENTDQAAQTDAAASNDTAADQQAADEVAALIDAIYVQQRTDETD